MLFLFEGVSSSSRCLGWAALFYCGTPSAFHIIIWQVRRQGQLLEGVECHIYLYCFTFDDINLNRAFVIIVLFPNKYSNKKVCANDVGKLNALGFYWYNFFSFNVIINATFSG